MLELLKRLGVYGRFFTLVRAGICLGFSLLLLGGALVIAQGDGSRNDMESPRDIEHRFTALETKVDIIIEKMRTEEWSKWFGILGISGLLGEKGLSLIRKGR